jgi:hypothetical protein
MRSDVNGSETGRMADELSRRERIFGSASRTGATSAELIARVAFVWALAIGVSLAASAAGAWIGH